MTTSDNKIICPKCNSELPQDSGFCQYCGCKIENSSTTIDTIAEENSAPADEVVKAENESEAVAKILASGIIEGQKAMEANKENQPHYELDADFGLVPQKPVYTVGIDEQEKYLKSLRTINGEPIKWNRRGSMSVDSVNGMVDVYDIYLPSGVEYKTIYVNMYGAYNSGFAPKGFSISSISATPNQTKHQKIKKKRKWIIPVIASVVGVIIISIVALVLGIPASKYNKACSKLENGFYQEAIEMFEELDGYKKSEDKINEAKYGYVSKHKNNDDVTTYEYLKALKKQDYKDAITIYNDLYKWRISGVINTDSNNYYRHENSISKYCDYVHASFTITGGTPGEKIDVTHTTIYPDGETYVSDWHWYDEYDNSSFGCEWSTGFYNNPQYGDTGTFVIKIYNLKTGEFIGSVTTRITD